MHEQLLRIRTLVVLVMVLVCDGSPNGVKSKHPQKKFEQDHPPHTQSQKNTDVGQIRTDAPKGTRFQVLRDNHSATTPSSILSYQTSPDSPFLYNTTTSRGKGIQGEKRGSAGRWEREVSGYSTPRAEAVQGYETDTCSSVSYKGAGKRVQSTGHV
ncbi:hypothetical protein K491DRAFT_110764 [Lophiostoma macrostomum CBS 122681]|uniref:Secreted protein n=1 Tax=Lophiostoma macrostomum CBS 122681 TaxID=1314788 RepID=A0A6A6STC8_9PLEO|nr:hypothetical protein K491DRAFT_110764 [Lophiostoma macrostomum CBS 122681]